ncbi:hypothetical protein TSOC_014883 [Tetrabaena socialis]|uniref:Uncharacterized protein n=1 Tax=Tetrabaena socialis TaxID=47790 RepID=A0A2J7ZGE1_9CHLO|nr:hypothetical protein TSOC_014883 [Tetrabaena socialis]|eukprot:PNG99342.1 hypothetical protein TSOC_014883 [Tetrabaena socialis]
MPWSEDEAAALAALPAHEVAAAGAERRRAHALARVAALARWAESLAYRQIMRAAVL